MNLKQVLIGAGVCVTAVAGCTSSRAPSHTSSPSMAASGVSIGRLVNSPTPTPDIPASTRVSCDVSLWKHIYHPARLHLISACLTVTGRIVKVNHDPDGDLHIQVHLDSSFTHLIDTANTKYQHGALVVEAICEGTVTQADAIKPCQGISPVVLPALKTGERVQVTGSYVLDKDHGWMEIHPVSRIMIRS